MIVVKPKDAHHRVRIRARYCERKPPAKAPDEALAVGGYLGISVCHLAVPESTHEVSHNATVQSRYHHTQNRPRDQEKGMQHEQESFIARLAACQPGPVELSL